MYAFITLFVERVKMIVLFHDHDDVIHLKLGVKFKLACLDKVTFETCSLLWLLLVYDISRQSKM